MKMFVRRVAPPPDRRRGAVIVLLALLLIGVFACTALCIDVGWMTATKSSLQNAADSAAAAGAAQLQTHYGSYSIAPQAVQTSITAAATVSASTYSTLYASYNGAGEVGSLALPASDIVYGFTDANGHFAANAGGFPNTVQVTTRRDSSANTSLSLFFAPVIGRESVDLTASSSATVYTGLISAFNYNGGGESSFGGSGGSGHGWGDDYAGAGGGFNCTLLPLAFDMNHWNQFVSNGTSPDGVVHADAAGVPQIQVYPSPKNSPGNFGLLCIGPWTNAQPIYSNWVLNGPSDSDLQALVNAGSFPVSTTSPKPWKGSPGLKSSLLPDFIAIKEQPRLLPIFRPATTSPYQAASGNGSNTTYSIVGFVGVKVTVAAGHGTNMTICVQPCDVIDPTAVFDSATLFPAGTEPPSQLKTFTHPAVKFTR